MDVIAHDLRRQREMAERLRWFLAELTAASASATAELDEAIRTLRADSRSRLLHPDRGYPDSLTVAVAELGRRHVHRTHELTYTAAAKALAGCDAGIPRFTLAWKPPTISPPHRGRRRAADLVMMVALPLGLMLVRLPWMAGALPSALGCGLTVSAGLMIAWWVASSRRAGVEADTLTRWTEEVLRDIQRSLDSASGQRQLDAHRQMRQLFLHLADRHDAPAIPTQSATPTREAPEAAWDAPDARDGQRAREARR